VSATAPAQPTPVPKIAKPVLVMFRSRVSGRCERVAGFLAQVLQRRRNHTTFSVRHVHEEERPDLFDRFGIDVVPTLVVIEDRRVRGRLSNPRNSAEITSFLAPWLK
jgi:thioredoxin 1